MHITVIVITFDLLRMPKKLISGPFVAKTLQKTLI